LLEELSRTGQCFVTLTGLEAWPRSCELPASVYRVDTSVVHQVVIPAKAGIQALDHLLEESLQTGFPLSRE